LSAFIKHVTFDYVDPHRQTLFWSEATG